MDTLITNFTLPNSNPPMIGIYVGQVEVVNAQTVPNGYGSFYQDTGEHQDKANRFELKLKGNWIMGEFKTKGANDNTDDNTDGFVPDESSGTQYSVFSKAKNYTKPPAFTLGNPNLNKDGTFENGSYAVGGKSKRKRKRSNKKYNKKTKRKRTLRSRR